MKNRAPASFAAALILIISTAAVANIKSKTIETASILEFTMRSLSGESVDLSRYRGAVVLIVNVASECGLHLPVRRPAESARKVRRPGTGGPRVSFQ